MTQNENLSAKEELLARLATPEIREEIKAWSLTVLKVAEDLYSGGGNLAGCKDNWNFSLHVGYLRSLGYTPETFDRVVANLAEPCIITAEELADVFRVYIDVKDKRLHGDFDQLYQGYLDYIRFRVLVERVSAPIELCELWWNVDEDDAKSASLIEQVEEQEAWLTAHHATLLDPQLDNDAKITAARKQIHNRIEKLIDALKAELATIPPRNSELDTVAAIGKAEILGETPQFPLYEKLPGAELASLLWAQNGLTLKEVGIRSVSSSLGKRAMEHGTLLGQLSGTMSESVLKKVTEELTPAIRSILRSVSFLQSRAEDNLYDPPVNGELPNLFPAELQKHRDFVQKCTSMLFLPASEEDNTMAHSFSNAIRLISLADRQTTPAITLALSMTALEALFGKEKPDYSQGFLCETCKKALGIDKDGITSSLAKNVSILLESDVNHRRDAELFIRYLYNSRCKTLHGTTLDTHVADADDARALAAGCLYSLWSHSGYRERFSEQSDEPEALLAKLKEGGRPNEFDPDLPAVYELWRSVYAFWRSVKKG